MSIVISVLASCVQAMKDKRPFNPIENKAFYEFLCFSMKSEDNIRIRLNLLHIHQVIYTRKKVINLSEEIWLLAYLEGALLDHDVYV